MPKELLLDVAGIVFRSVVMFFVSLVAVRITGKRSIGQLAPFDLVVIIIIGSVAALPLEEEQIDMLHGIVPIVVLTGLQYLLALVNMHWRAAEKVTQGLSTPIVVDGKVMQGNLKRERVSEADMHILLREAGADKVEDLALAVLEPTGKVSIVKKAQAQPVTPQDMDLMTLTRLDRIRAEMRSRRQKNYRDVVCRLPCRILGHRKRTLL